MAAETPAETRTAPAAGNTANKNSANRAAAKKIWTSPVFWSSLRACLFLAAAIALITELLRPVWRRDPA
jgi:hypothetical protein